MDDDSDDFQRGPARGEKRSLEIPLFVAGSMPLIRLQCDFDVYLFDDIDTSYFLEYLTDPMAGIGGVVVERHIEAKAPQSFQCSGDCGSESCRTASICN